MHSPIWEQWPTFFRGIDTAMRRLERRAAWVERMQRYAAPLPTGDVLTEKSSNELR
jgi:hypothetical protein